ncbi:MAG TPA: phosphotransferase [Chloroflexota bacterium]|nr:phosphotransferase [Chloroflexota bacterium]
MRTQPVDLSETLIVEGLAYYSVRPTALEYLPVGFGSHHWRAADRQGRSLFLTVDDLYAKLAGVDDTHDAVFERLSRAFATAKTLRDRADLDFVVAPLAAQDDSLAQRLTDRYSLAVFPMLDGVTPDADGEFTSDTDRAAVLSILVELHAVETTVASDVREDPSLIPNRAELMATMDDLARPWNEGPYGEPARRLLSAHADDVVSLLGVYDRLAQNVSRDRNRMVITHGEPHAANVLITADGYRLVDWDSVLVAPPERDLSMLGGGRDVLDTYSAATGVAVRPDAMDLYQMWFDLAEIAGYIRIFYGPHVGSADSAESWRNLTHFLRPRERWSGYFGT